MKKRSEEKKIIYPAILKLRKAGFKISGPLVSDSIFINNYKKFDVIISDVSSINDFIAKESDWYDGVVCDSGDDGLKNIFKILSSIEKNLKKNGHFILPIISLSNEKELIRLLKRRFKKISFSKKVYWPLSDFFKKKINRYKKLKEESKINFEEKFGVFLAYSYSAECCGLK